MTVRHIADIASTKAPYILIEKDGRTAKPMTPNPLAIFGINDLIEEFYRRGYIVQAFSVEDLKQSHNEIETDDSPTIYEEDYAEMWESIHETIDSKMYEVALEVIEEAARDFLSYE